MLRDSVIVCATISVCGSNDLTSLVECFDTVVVDEASQASSRQLTGYAALLADKVS